MWQELPNIATATVFSRDSQLILYVWRIMMLYLHLMSKYILTDKMNLMLAYCHRPLTGIWNSQLNSNEKVTFLFSQFFWFIWFSFDMSVKQEGGITQTPYNIMQSNKPPNNHWIGSTLSHTVPTKLHKGGFYCRATLLAWIKLYDVCVIVSVFCI